MGLGMAQRDCQILRLLTGEGYQPEPLKNQPWGYDTEYPLVVITPYSFTSHTRSLDKFSVA